MWRQVVLTQSDQEVLILLTSLFVGEAALMGGFFLAFQSKRPVRTEAPSGSISEGVSMQIKPASRRLKQRRQRFS